MTEATDAAIRLAEERELDVSLIEGTGKDGAVTVDDVRRVGEENDSGAGSDLTNYCTLNPHLDIGSYTFEDGKTFINGAKIRVTEDEYARYSGEKYRGVQVVVKA